MKRIRETAKQVLTAVKKNPLDIKLLLLFSFLIIVIDIIIGFDSNKNIYEIIIPYTGSQPKRPYFSVFFFIIIYSYVFRNHKKILLFIRGICVFFIGFSLYDGIFDWITILPEDYTNPNPYLRYHILAPVYTIALPLFWILVLTGSQLADYFNNKKTKTIQ